MKCREVQEWLPLYWDLSDDDWNKKQVDAHVKHCPACAADFQIWEESKQLISAQFAEQNFDTQGRISKHVMERIYADESWRIPIPERMYAFSYRLKRNLNIIVSFCLALFTISLMYSLLHAPREAQYSAEISQFVPVAVAPSDDDLATIQSTTMQGVPVASINDPIVWSINPTQSYPDYLLVVSIIGFVATILTMSWLSRVKH